MVTGGGTHLEVDPGDPAQRFRQAVQFDRDRFRAAYDVRTLRRAKRIELRSRGPSAIALRARRMLVIGFRKGRIASANEEPGLKVVL
jgi:hypothetical protein